MAALEASQPVQGFIPSSPKRKLRPEDYTVGWISPLEVEQIAALEMLDEEHERLPQPPTDHNVYSLGSIGGHNIVVAGLPIPGNNSAAAVVTQMRTRFPNLRFGLLVGIGGGVPVKTDNGMIRLGDVVVSKPAGEHSGAVQYDRGKAETGQFQRTGVLPPPPAVLLSAAQDLAAKRARSRNDPVVENIRRINTDIPGLRKYKHPGVTHDRLYPSDYIHLDPTLSCDQCGCDPSLRIQRDIDENESDEPHVVVHRGTIASSDLVVKNSKLRDQLAKQHGIFCFEMEAAGALADFPCIVIRGVSDYCDSHKNDRWHGYAAAAAAAYARQLFIHMPIDEVKSFVPPPIEDAVNHLVERHENQERRIICDWLSPIDYGTQQSDFISRRQEGTGQWLLNSDEFQQWTSQKKQTLFCPGIPGAGKTMISSIIVDHLTAIFRNDAKIGIAYIYCNYQPQQEQRPEDLLLNLLKQLAQEQRSVPRLPTEVRHLYERHRTKGTRPTLNEITRALHSTVQLYSRVFIIVDALDEYHVSNNEGQKIFLPEIFGLQNYGHVNFFATSRFVLEITSQFKGCKWKEIRAQDDDILSYVDGRIPQLLRSQISNYLEEYPDLKNLIRSDVAKAVDGMFLLARLHMDSLMSQPTLGHIKQALRNLPQGIKGLDETYEQGIRRIEDSQGENYRKLAKQVLSWVTYAKRPLSTLEIQHALAVRSDMDDMDEDFLPEVKTLGSVCAGLITIDEKSDIIRLVHYTAQEYFKRTSSLHNAESTLAVACLNYLSFNTFATGFCSTDREFETRLHLNPLYDYAARNWGYHVRAASASIQHSIPAFLMDEAKFSSSSQAMMASSEYRYSGYSQGVPQQMTAVHLAAYFGLAQITAALLGKGYQSDCEDSYGRTPLSWAAERGHDAVVKALLVREDVGPDSKDTKYGRTPLSWAAKNGHEAVVKALLARDDVDTESKDIFYGRTPLSWAAGNGHEAVAKALLARDDVDPDSKDAFYGQTPLSWAAENGHEAVVKVLLARDDVDLNSKDTKYGQTPLWWAAQNGHKSVVKALLTRTDIDPNSKDSDGQTPLCWAAEKGHEVVVQALLARDDVDLNSKGCGGRTSLSWAAKEGHETVVKILLTRDDINPNSEDSNGRTPLSLAAENGHKAVVKKLLTRNDINLNSKDKDNRTPLWWAAEKGYETIVKILLARDNIDSDSKDKHGRTPLSWSAGKGHESIVKELLARNDVNPDSKDRDSRTPLWWAAEKGHETVVKILLARNDIDPNSKDRDSRTPLWWAAGTGHETVVKALLTRDDINPDSKDRDGRTPLWWAAGIGHEAVVKALLERNDVNPDFEDKDGRTPLSWAAGKGHEAVVEVLLVQNNVNPDSKDRYGRTPLWWAAGKGHEATVKALLAQNNVDPNSEDRDGRTPLSSTAEKGPEGVVKILLTRDDVNLNSKDVSGRTPLLWAAEKGHESVVKVLLARDDIDPNSKDRDSRTPLSWAAGKGHEMVVKALLARDDIDLNSKDRGGRTPLSWAAEKGHEVVIKTLLARDDVDPNSKDRDGQTALSWAVRNGYEVVAKLLQSRGHQLP